jgi:hypothetical protein
VFEETVEYELEGRVNLQFHSEGVQCDIEVPNNVDTWYIETDTGAHET